MKALTIIQPWAWAICHAGKRIENRKWRPPKSLIGERFAIHAGAKFDPEAAGDLWLEGFRPTTVPQSAIVATVRLLGVLTRESEKDWTLEKAEGESDPDWLWTPNAMQWFQGPVGWVLDYDVYVLPVPVPCSGAQGLWDVPKKIQREILKEAA